VETGTLDPPVDEAQDDAVEAGDVREPDEDGGDDGYPGDLAIEGTSQLSFSVGGRSPTVSKLTVQGGAIEIEGQFEKGQRLAIMVEVEVREVAFRDQVDPKTGTTIGCSRKHKAVVVGVERA